MSCIPPTPPITPYGVRSVYQLARLTGASVLARDAANALVQMGNSESQTQQGFGRTRIVPPKKIIMPYKKSAPKKKVSAQLMKQIKKASLMQTEIKTSTLVPASTGLLHGTQLACNVTAAITQGVQFYQRVGDEVFLNSIRFNITVQSPTASGAYSYRLMFVYSGEEYATTALSAASLPATEVFLGGASTTNPYTGVANRKAVTVLWDQVVDINSVIAATRDVQTVRGVLNLRNVRFPYQTSTSVYGKVKNIYFVVLPNVANGTIGSTACGAIDMSYSIDFRDP